MIDTRCGLRCEGCEYVQSCGCEGCIATNGHPFHGECPVARCCQEKGYIHCGQCPVMPCELLQQYACDPEHGDNPPGARIEQCREWAKHENMEKITVIPYLSFNGCCEEAINAYIAAFGGEVYYLSRWSEETCGGVPEKIGKVMHAEFTLGSTRMSGGDTFDCAEGNTAIRLMIHMENKDQALRAVEKLAQGGEVISPLKPHPKPDDGGCGSVTKDRFGYTWIITCPNPDKTEEGAFCPD